MMSSRKGETSREGAPCCERASSCEREAWRESDSVVEDLEEGATGEFEARARIRAERRITLSSAGLKVGSGCLDGSSGVGERRPRFFISLVRTGDSSRGEEARAPSGCLLEESMAT